MRSVTDARRPRSEKPGSRVRVTTVGAERAGPFAQPDEPVAARACRRCGPAPSSRISTRSGCSTTVQRVALLCRITLVTPSRIVQANSSRFSEGTSSVELGRSASISAASSAVRARASSPGRVSSR